MFATRVWLARGASSPNSAESGITAAATGEGFSPVVVTVSPSFAKVELVESKGVWVGVQRPFVSKELFVVSTVCCWFDPRTTGSTIRVPPPYALRTTLLRGLASGRGGSVRRVVADEQQGIARRGMVAGGGLGLHGAHEAPLLQTAQGGRQRAAAPDAAAAVEHLALPRGDAVEELRVADRVLHLLEAQGASHHVEQREQLSMRKDVDLLIENLVRRGGRGRAGERHHAPPIASWRGARRACRRQ